jgi:hypothetical protein
VGKEINLVDVRGKATVVWLVTSSTLMQGKRVGFNAFQVSRMTTLFV